MPSLEYTASNFITSFIRPVGSGLLKPLLPKPPSGNIGVLTVGGNGPPRTIVGNEPPRTAQLRDLLLIVDASGSVTLPAFTTAKSQLAKLMGRLCPYPNHDPFQGHHQAALIEYSSTVVDVFDFNDKYNTQQVQSAINAMPFLNGWTCTATALRQGINIFNTARGMRTDPNVKNEVLILTDGLSNCGGNAKNAAADLKKKADVYVLMIGRFSADGRNKLNQYVSEPVDKHLFALRDFRDLASLFNISETALSGQNPCLPFDFD